MPRFTRFHWLNSVLFGCLASWAFAGDVEIPKLEREASFSIKEGPLESALIQFSRQADIQVMLAADAAAHVMTSAVFGRLAANVALATLLEGTGFVYTTVGNTVMVRSSESKPMKSVGEKL